jgi:hypothetical protein
MRLRHPRLIGRVANAMLTQGSPALPPRIAQGGVAALNERRRDRRLQRRDGHHSCREASTQFKTLRSTAKGEWRSALRSCFSQMSSITSSRR